MQDAREQFIWIIAVLTSCISHQAASTIKDDEETGSPDLTFTARIKRRGTNVCNGVLVDREWVATLTECIDISSLSQYEVRFTSFDSADEKVYVTRELKSTKIVGDDIILLRLNTKILRSTDGVRPFGRFSSKQEDYRMTNCKAVRISANGERTEVSVNIKPTEEQMGPSSDTILLLDTAQGVLCENYNGAPLMCKLGTKWKLTGLLSLKNGCERENTNSFRLSYFRRAIQNAISGQETPSESVCLKPGCTKAAARVIETMDSSVNPCDDFYKFACGTWVQENVIPEGKSFTSILSEMWNDVTVTLKRILEGPIKSSDLEAMVKAKHFYQACVDTNKIEENGPIPVLLYIIDMGGLPVLGQGPGGHWDPGNYTVEDLLLRTGVEPLVGLSVEEKPADITVRRILIKQPTLGMPNRDFYIDSRYGNILKAYQTKLKEFYVALGANKTMAETYAEDVVNFEVDLASISEPWRNQYVLPQLGNLVYLNIKGIDLVKLIRISMQRVGIEIEDSEIIRLDYPFGYFVKLGDVLSKYPDSVVVNYVVTRKALDTTIYLPQVFRDIEQAFQKELYQTESTSPRWKTCIYEAMDNMKEVVGRLFVEKAFKKKEKSDVLELVVHHKNVFKGMIKRLKWLTEPTKRLVKRKIKLMGTHVGYPESYFNDERLDSIYENSTVYVDDPLSSFISVKEDTVRRNLKSFRQDVDKEDALWSDGTVMVNAFNGLLYNEIIFLAGILQSPFYSRDQPAYMNYGAIGMIIGHEMLHGVDSNGINFNRNGRYGDWWAEEDKDRFIDRAKCFVDQYNKYVVPGTGGQTVDGYLTLNENIADNGGLKESFLAYNEWVKSDRNSIKEKKLPGLEYSPAQLFYLSFAQSWCRIATKQFKKSEILTSLHTSQRFRAIGPLQNSEEFSKVWNCPVGSYMNPADKCSLW